jgi:hypothetical protein
MVAAVGGVVVSVVIVVFHRGQIAADANYNHIKW